MSKLIVLFCLVAAACTSAERQQLAAAQLAAKEADDAISSSVASCVNSGMAAQKARGQIALADWDQAAADNVDNVSASQEQEIRASLGAEMGLAPSQVNGWKNIYRGRAAAAKREHAQAQAAYDSADKELPAACTGQQAAYTRLYALNAEVRRLKAVVREIE